MTGLLPHLLSRIATNGPLTISEYMSECLLHPKHGYYATRDPFGFEGDFVTAPEITQMFGELLGLCLAQSWLDQGSPAHAILAELGPGRGTLMADILRATKNVPGFRAAMQIHLVEASPHLKEVQRNTLSGTVVTWHDSVGTLPDAPLFAVANEFFDALPIRQFIRTDKGWSERLVGAKDDALTFGLGAPAVMDALMPRFVDTCVGQMVEHRPAADAIMNEIDNRLAQQKAGAAVILDYGDWHSLGDTLQAIHRQRYADVLSNPGEADLTAHVDFEALVDAGGRTSRTGMTAQGVLLERLGIAARARSLAQKLSGDALQSHIAAHRRLTHPDEMGTLFKAIAFHPVGTPPPPGFDVAEGNE